MRMLTCLGTFSGTPGLEKYAAKIASEGLELRELDPDHREEMVSLCDLYSEISSRVRASKDVERNV